MGKSQRVGSTIEKVYSLSRPRPLPSQQLPLYRDVDLALEDAKVHKQMSPAEAVNKVTDEVINLYTRSSISTINPVKIKQKVASVLELRRNHIKNIAEDSRTGKVRDQFKHRKRKKNGLTNKIKLREVQDKIFEVKKDVPDLEMEFYKDQCGTRLLFIGPLDRKTTDENKTALMELEASEAKKKKREAAVEKRSKREELRKQQEVSNSLEEPNSEEMETDDDLDKVEYQVSHPKRKREQEDEDEEKLPDLLEIVERFDISETAASHVFNLFSKNKKLSQCQMNQKKKKARIEKARQFTVKRVKAIGFDERKDITKVEDGVGKAGRKRFTRVREEHCAVVLWPGEVFAGHVVPSGGKATELAADLDKFFKDRPGIDISGAQVLISDGCEKMLGWKTGVHASFEKLMGRRFLRVVCFFHHIELSFTVIIKLYGVYTTSPNSFVAPWNELLTGDIHKIPVVAFQVLPNPPLLALINRMSIDVLKDLGTDHRIFIGIIKMVITGEVDEQYASMKIGPMVTSRFTTTETRFGRHWLSTSDPTFEETRVMRFLVYVWAEVFLTAKEMNRFEHGPRLLLLELMLAKKHCSQPEFTMLKSSLDFNGQNGHHESILVSLLASPELEDRQLAVNTIFTIREQGPRTWNTPSGQRPFKVNKTRLVHNHTKI